MNHFDVNPDDFKLINYSYTLPQSAIAQNPANPKESAKLLVYERQSERIIHTDFYHFCDFIPKGTLIVLNDSKVIKARIYAHKIDSFTAKLKEKPNEIFFHKALESSLFLVQIRGRVKSGDRFIVKDYSEGSLIIEVRACLENGMRLVCFMQDEIVLSYQDVLEVLQKYGHTPIPPYIKRDDTPIDDFFYQSIFAKHLGSIAAPTASLHFSHKSLEAMEKYFDLCFITLHIGAGTFMKVESSDIRSHQIHTESYCLSQENAKAIEEACRVLCIGTTSARCVEYYVRHRHLEGECDIFLYPGVDFRRVDYLLTNFHLPQSTLLMLVSAMIGREKCLELYQIALRENYRFYSYGDGMLIL